MARNEQEEYGSRISPPGAAGHKFVSRHLDTNGDGTGTKNAIGNYASSATPFYIQPPAGTRYALTRVVVTVEDTGSFDAGDYGNGVALSNGIIPRVRRDIGGTPSTLVDFSDGVPITANADWGRLCYDVDVKTWGVGPEVLLVRWTFGRSGRLLVLDGELADGFEMLLNDNFSGLNAHYFLVQGFAF